MASCSGDYAAPLTGNVCDNTSLFTILPNGSKVVTLVCDASYPFKTLVSGTRYECLAINISNCSTFVEGTLCVVTVSGDFAVPISGQVADTICTYYIVNDVKYCI